MNKPVDLERIANENTVEEQKTNIAFEEGATILVEETVEIPAVVDEQPVSEEKAETSSREKEVPEFNKLDKVEIVNQLSIVVQEPLSDEVRDKVDGLKQTFYKLKRIETENAKQVFVQSGGLEEDFVPETDEWEENLKSFLAIFREKKASVVVETEKVKEENLSLKKTIIEKLKTLIDSQDDFYKVYNEFRKLQQQWKDIKHIPQAAVNDLWKEYQHYTEKFYDLLKINNEMRDYDFKKNMELKQTLCEAVERLDEEKDVISAFYQLQKLHQEWREIGPVAKEFREEIWMRFKKASSVINKKHQDHFESLRSLEHRNLEEKIALCEEIESIDYTQLTTFKIWDEQNKKVLNIQEKWKTIGFAPKKSNVKIFERFRRACDIFFSKKNDFYKLIKSSMEANLEKKKALCEKAEALKESQDWKETTDKLIALQKEWKTIGQVPRKYSDSIWTRFISACDYFFEKKNIHFSSQKSSEIENLKKKKEIIAQIDAIDENLAKNEAVTHIRELMFEFNNTGFVPFREKDKIYKEFQTAVDKHFDRLKMDESERRLQSFKSNLGEIAGDGKSKNKLLSEREKLMRTYERLKSDIQTYENNIGFLSVSSKGGGGLLKEMNHKIETLKEELDLIVKKIEVIDESLGFEE
jgi:peptidase E